MIIARPEWFGRRKYGGWGVSIKTWQGALYLASIIMLILLIQLLPLEAIARLYVTGAGCYSSSLTCLMLCGRFRGMKGSTSTRQ